MLLGVLTYRSKFQDLDLLEHIKRDFKSSIWSQSATLIGQILTTARKPRKNVVQQHVPYRMLGFGDKSEAIKKKRSLTSSIRARITSNSSDKQVAVDSPMQTSESSQQHTAYESEEIGDGAEPDLDQESDDGIYFKDTQGGPHQVEPAKNLSA